jgi:hypothetical protein
MSKIIYLEELQKIVDNTSKIIGVKGSTLWASKRFDLLDSEENRIDLNEINLYFQSLKLLLEYNQNLNPGYWEENYTLTMNKGGVDKQVSRTTTLLGIKNNKYKYRYYDTWETIKNLQTIVSTNITYEYKDIPVKDAFNLNTLTLISLLNNKLKCH